MGNDVKKKMIVRAAGILVMCFALSMFRISSGAWQDANLSVSGNVGNQSSVLTENESLGSISGGDLMDFHALEPETEPVPVPIIRLQVPDNLNFVIDPWNISGKGQIYSEWFTIVNCGDTACTIQLQDISCTDLKGIIIVEDAGQLHMRDEAGIYLELVFENGETRALTEEGQEYAVVLNPNEELTFWLTGAVNERNPESWGNKALSVKLKFFGFFVE